MEWVAVPVKHHPSIWLKQILATARLTPDRARAYDPFAKTCFNSVLEGASMSVSKGAAAAATASWHTPGATLSKRAI